VIPAKLIGERLRDARQSRGLTLRALGDLTGFSASFHSQVELGQASPSLGSLQRIADALGITVSRLLATEEEVSGVVVRKAVRDAAWSEWSNASVEPLVQASADDKLQALLVRLEPTGKTGRTACAKGRRLFAYCTSGAAFAALSEQPGDLLFETGDSLVIDGPCTIAWENRSSEPTELLVVTTITTV
jgi:XRE family transcriptional regulator, regulator of sulfur utilization